MGIIGSHGIEDAFMLDVLASDIANQPVESPARSHRPDTYRDLARLDDAEHIAVLKTRTVTYRKRHARMTTNLLDLLVDSSLRQGDGIDRRFDVLVPNYDANGRDLLIEAKPDPDRGAIRIAIGQLLDYRRWLDRPDSTDLALLTIKPPSKSYRDLLNEQQITALWFTDEKCLALQGEGKAWRPISRKTM
jgi:hypothetical protein